MDATIRRRASPRATRKLWLSTAVSTAALVSSGALAQADGLWQPQVRTVVDADEGGVRSALEAFLPVVQDTDTALFLDLRFTHDFENRSTQSVGLGVRHLPNPDLLVGGYAYLHVARQGGHHFTGATLGIEAITANFDAHVNVHLPLGKRSRTSPGGASSSLSLVGNQLLEQISTITQRDYANWGIEGEIGVQAPINLPPGHGLRLHVGAYHFDDPDGIGGSVTGGRAGFEYTISDIFDSRASLSFGGEVRHDNADDTSFAGFARLSIPLGPAPEPSADAGEPILPVNARLAKRVNERVRGDIGLRIDRTESTASSTRRAINAATGRAFGEFFFADGENTLGLGTIGDPTTLDDAVARADDGFVVALGGAGDILTEGVALTDGQTVIGGGGSVRARLISGAVQAFAFGGSNGHIAGANAGNNVITLGQDNTLSGISVSGGAAGIFGVDASGTVLQDVTVTGAGSHGAAFSGAATEVDASNFTATGNGGSGLSIAGDGDYSFTGTTLLSGNAVDGLNIVGDGTYAFGTLNTIDNGDDGIDVTSTSGSFSTTGGTVSGNGDVGVKIDPVELDVTLTSISHAGGSSGIVLDDVSGSFTVTGDTTISGTSGPAIAISNSSADISFADVDIDAPGGAGIVVAGANAGAIEVSGQATINAPGADGVDLSGATSASLSFADLSITGLAAGRTGIDMSGGASDLSVATLQITGTGGAGSTGIDLSGTGAGTTVDIGAGTIAGVDTGVQLGVNGAAGATANATLTFGQGSIGGMTAALDMRGLSAAAGTYDFGTTTFAGPQLFDPTGVLFIGSAATGAGNGSSVNDLATIDFADALTDSGLIFALVNDGAAIVDADGFTLAAGQTLASFGNGRTFSAGGAPANVTGDNIIAGAEQADPTGNGAATLTGSGAAATVALADGSAMLDLAVSNSGAGAGIVGIDVVDVLLSGITVSGAAGDGVQLGGASVVAANNLTSTGNGGSGLSIAGDGDYTFTGVTTLSGNAADGLSVVGAGNYDFATLNAADNADDGIDVTSPGGSFSTVGGAVAGNGDLGVGIDGGALDVSLGSISHSGGASGLVLDGVSGNFAVAGATTISNTTGPAIAISDASAAIGFGDLDISGAGGGGVVVAGANTGAIAVTGDAAIAGSGGIDLSGATSATLSFDTLEITGLAAGQTGIDLAGGRASLSVTTLSIAGTGGAASTGIDLSATQAGTTVDIGAIDTAGVDTGVQLGANGAGGATANATLTIGGGQIGGATAALDMRGLSPTSGSYAFGPTVFNGAQLFDATNVVFVAATATGAGDGSTVGDRATIDFADAITDSNAIFALINDGDDIVDDSGFTLSDGQILASFGNGRTFNIGGAPINVTGDNIATGVTVADPTGNGAATLTGSNAGGTVTLADNNLVADLVLSNSGPGPALTGADVTGVTLTNLAITGAGGDGAAFAGASQIAATGFSSTGNAGSGLSIAGDGDYDFAGVTTLSDNAVDGLSITGDGGYHFDVLNVQNNLDDGIEIASANGSFSTTGGTVSGNGDVAVKIDPIALAVTLTSITHSGGSGGILLDDVSGTFAVTGATTISNTTGDGVSVSNSSADISLGTLIIDGAGGDAVSLTGLSGDFTVSGGSIGAGATPAGAAIRIEDQQAGSTIAFRELTIATDQAGAIALTNANGAVILTNVDVDHSGPGLALDVQGGTGSLTIDGGNFEARHGAGIRFDDAGGVYQINTAVLLDDTGVGSGIGLDIFNSSGNFAFADLTIVNTAPATALGAEIGFGAAGIGVDIRDSAGATTTISRLAVTAPDIALAARMGGSVAIGDAAAPSVFVSGFGAVAVDSEVSLANVTIFGGNGTDPGFLIGTGGVALAPGRQYGVLAEARALETSLTMAGGTASGAAGFGAFNASAVDLIVDVSGVTLSSTTTEGFRAGATGGGETFIAGFDGVTIDAGLGGAAFSGVIFDADPSTAAIETVSGAGTTAIGSVGARVGGTGLSIAGSTGAIEFGALSIFTSGGAGLDVLGAAGDPAALAVGAGGGTIDAAGEAAMVVSSATLDATFGAVSSSGAVAAAVDLFEVAGALTVNGGSITGPVADGVRLDMVSANVTLSGLTIDTPDDFGVHIIDPVGGAVTTINSTVLDAGDTAILLETTVDGSDGKLAVTGGAYSGDFAGLEVAPANPGSYEIAISGGSFAGSTLGATPSILIDGCACAGDVTITEFGDFTVSGPAGGVVVNVAEFAVATPGGPITIGSGADPAAFGLLMTDVTGTLNLSRLDVTVAAGPALGVDNSFQPDATTFQLTIAGGDITATNGEALYLDTFTADITFDTVSSTGAGFDAGLLLANLSGTVQVTGATTVANSLDDGIHIVGGDADFTFGGAVTVTNAGDDGIDIDDLAGNATFLGAVQITTPAGDGMAFNDNPGALTFADVTVDTPGESGVDFNGVNGLASFGDVEVAQLGGGAGLELFGATVDLTMASLDVDGTGAGGSVGIDLRDTQAGAVVTITNGGQIDDVATGVLLGTAGTTAETANADFTFGGGRIEGSVASIDARGLVATSGTYAFETTDLVGPQLFDGGNVFFVGSAASGTGDGSSYDNRATIADADALTDANLTIVLVNDGADIVDDGFTLSDGQSLVSFGNGRTVMVGGLPVNVTGDNVINGFAQGDDLGFGAARLTAGGAADTITLGNDNFVADLIVSNSGAGDAIQGLNIADLSGTGITIDSGADGLNLTGVTGAVTLNDTTVSATTGDGIEIATSSATFDFTGTTSISGVGDEGVALAGANGAVAFADLVINGTGGRGLEIFGATDDVTVAAGGIGLVAPTTGFAVLVQAQAATSTVSLTDVDIVGTVGGNTPDLLALTNNAGVITTVGGTLTQGSINDTVDITGGTATITIGSALAGGGSGGAAVEIDGTSGDIAFTGPITNSGGAWAIDIGATGAVTGGTISFGGTVTDTGSSGIRIANLDAPATVDINGAVNIQNPVTTGISVATSSGTVRFDGAVTVNSGAQNAIDLATVAGGSVIFTSGLDIDTTTGIGFRATGAGAVGVGATGTQAISTQDDGVTVAGAALSLAGVTIDATTGVNFDQITVSGAGGAGASSAVVLDATSGGTLSITGLFAERVSSDAISIANVVGGTYNFDDVTVAIAVLGSSGIDIANSAGVYSFTNIDLTAVNGAGVNLVDNAGDVTIDGGGINNAGSDGIASLNTDLTVRNLVIGGGGLVLGHAIDISATGAASSTVSIDNVTTLLLNIASSAVNIQSATSGALTVDISNSALRSAGTALNAAETAGATANRLVLSVDDSTFATGLVAPTVLIDGATLSADTSSLVVTSFSGNTIEGGLPSSGISFLDAAFDSDLAAAGNQTVIASGTTQIGGSFRVAGDGIRFVRPSGSIDFETLNVFNDGGTGLLVITDPAFGTPDFTLGTGAGTIDTTDGAAIILGQGSLLDPVAVDMTLTAVSSTNGGYGIFLDEIAGTFEILGDVSIQNADDGGIAIRNSTLDAGFATGPGAGVEIGMLASPSTGIALDGNTAGTYTFGATTITAGNAGHTGVDIANAAGFDATFASLDIELTAGNSTGMDFSGATVDGAITVADFDLTSESQTGTVGVSLEGTTGAGSIVLGTTADPATGPSSVIDGTAGNPAGPETGVLFSSATTIAFTFGDGESAADVGSVIRAVTPIDTVDTLPNPGPGRFNFLDAQLIGDTSALEGPSVFVVDNLATAGAGTFADPGTIEQAEASGAEVIVLVDRSVNAAIDNIDLNAAAQVGAGDNTLNLADGQVLISLTDGQGIDVAPLGASSAGAPASFQLTGINASTVITAPNDGTIDNARPQLTTATGNTISLAGGAGIQNILAETTAAGGSTIFGGFAAVADLIVNQSTLRGLSGFSLDLSSTAIGSTAAFSDVAFIGRLSLDGSAGGLEVSGTTDNRVLQGGLALVGVTVGAGDLAFTQVVSTAGTPTENLLLQNVVIGAGRRLDIDSVTLDGGTRGLALEGIIGGGTLQVDAGDIDASAAGGIGIDIAGNNSAAIFLGAENLLQVSSGGVGIRVNQTGSSAISIGTGLGHLEVGNNLPPTVAGIQVVSVGTGELVLGNAGVASTVFSIGDALSIGAASGNVSATNLTLESAGAAGLAATNYTGQATFTDLTISGVAGGGDAVDIQQTAGTSNFDFTNLAINSAAGWAGGGVSVTASGAGAVDMAIAGLDVATDSGGGFTWSGAGTLEITGAANSIVTQSGHIINVTGNATVGAGGIAFDTLTAVNPITTPVVAAVWFGNIVGAGRTVDLGDVSIAGTTAFGISIQNAAPDFQVDSATIDAVGVGAAAIFLNGANGAVTFDTIDLDPALGAGLTIVGNTNAITVSGGSIVDPTGTAVSINSGTGDIDIAADIFKTTAGDVIEITGRSTGTVTVSGNLSATGASGGIDVNSNSGGSITFSGGSKVLSTGANTAVNLSGNNAAISFTNGGLNIDTTSGDGFAAGSGTLSVTGLNNTIATASGISLSLNGTTINGVDFASVTKAGAGSGIVLNGVSGPGAVSIDTADLSGITVAGVDLSGTIGPNVAFGDLDIGLAGGAAVAFDANGATVTGTVTADDFDVTNAGAAGTTIGVDLRGATGAGLVRLGDTVTTGIGADDATIAGLDTGVFFNNATNLDFVYGDGEAVGDTGSTISALTPIDASSAPNPASVYNFLDVGFSGSPGAGFGVGAIHFVDSDGATGGGDGSGIDGANPMTLTDAETALAAEDIIVLINNGSAIDTALLADDTLNLTVDAQVRGFRDPVDGVGSVPIELDITPPTGILLSITEIVIADPTGNGAATLTGPAVADLITLAASGNTIDGFILDGDPGNATRGIVDNGGASGTTISNMEVRNFVATGIEITPSTNTTIENVAFSGNGNDVFLNASNSVLRDITSTGAAGTSIRIDSASGTTTLEDIAITNAANGIFFLNAGVGSVIDANNVDISGPNALTVNGGAGAFDFDTASSIVNTAGTAVNIQNRSGGAITYNGTVVSNGAGNGINVAGATASNSVNFTGAVDLGVGTTLTGTAVSLNSANTTVSFASIDIVSNGTVGFAASGGGTVNVTTGTVNSTGAQALSLSGAAANVTFTSTTSSGGVNNVSLTNVTGTVNLGSGALSGATGTAFTVSGGSANIDYNGSISHNSNAVAVLVQNHTGTGGGGGGSTISFDGTITSNGSSDGISLINNDGTNGTTISFTNTLTLNTSASNSTAFSATDGGTVTATGSGSTISSGSGTALNVANTNIGAAGLTFQSISSNGGGAAGVILDNTGSAGGLTVTGTGVAGSGGTIANKTGNAVTLTNTRNVSLSNMIIDNNDGSGVGGTDVTNFSIIGSTVSNNADTATGAEAGLRFTGLYGSSAITGTIFSGSSEDHVRITNSSGVLTNLAVSGSTFNANSATTGGHGIAVINTGTSVATLTVTNTNFTNIRSSSVLMNLADTAAGTLNVSGGSFTDIGVAVTMQTSFSADLNFNVSGITSTRAVSNAIQLVAGSTGTNSSNIVGTISNNIVGNGAADSGSRDMFGIALDMRGDQDAIISVLNNNVRNTDFEGIWVSSADFGTNAAQNGRLDLHLRDNTVGAPDDNSGFPIGFIRGTLVDIRHTTTAYLDVAGNTSAGVGGAEGFRFRQRDTAQVFVERLTDGDGTAGETITDVTVLQNFFNAQNDPGSTSNVSLSGTNPGMIEAANGAARDPLMASSGFVQDGNAWSGLLTGDTLDGMIAAAKQRWADAGLSDDQLSLLDGVSFEIADLGGSYLALADGDTIRVDNDGAGHGWFVDLTPLDDEEFANGAGTQLFAAAESELAGQYDLLTTIMHELGHALGYVDTYTIHDGGTLMYGWLSQGERRLPDGTGFLRSTMETAAAATE